MHWFNSLVISLVVSIFVVLISELGIRLIIVLQLVVLQLVFLFLILILGIRLIEPTARIRLFVKSLAPVDFGIQDLLLDDRLGKVLILPNREPQAREVRVEELVAQQAAHLRDIRRAIGLSPRHVVDLVAAVEQLQLGQRLPLVGQAAQAPLVRPEPVLHFLQEFELGRPVRRVRVKTAPDQPPEPWRVESCDWSADLVQSVVSVHSPFGVFGLWIVEGVVAEVVLWLSSGGSVGQQAIHGSAYAVDLGIRHTVLVAFDREREGISPRMVWCDLHSKSGRSSHLQIAHGYLLSGSRMRFRCCYHQDANDP